MMHSVFVRAPCRLHFGMFSFGHDERAEFGGVGMMIAPPAIEVTIAPAARFSVQGPLSRRVEQYVNGIVRQWHLASLPACEITVQSPPDHVGLGVGTQLGLAVAAGLRQFLRLRELAVIELASSVGRGARSAVGTYGYRDGGLIVDAGKTSDRLLGTLARRLAVPEAWRAVLIRLGGARGMAGDREAAAFARLPPVPVQVTNELWKITEKELLPAVERADFGMFGEAIYRFGRLAGECFVTVQGGPFASLEIERLIEWIRGNGVAGVGQSSWGPTVFAFTADDHAAEALACDLRAHLHAAKCEIEIAQADNRGAQLRTL